VSRLAGAAESTAVPLSAARMAVALSWARAVRAVCLLIASQVRAWDWSQPRAFFPVRKVVSVDGPPVMPVKRNL
jgi:hypothetical protein